MTRDEAIEEAKQALGIKTLFSCRFECTECGEEWSMLWSAICDDECPACGTVMTPYEWEDWYEDEPTWRELNASP